MSTSIYLETQEGDPGQGTHIVGVLVRLEVAVHDAIVVQILQGEHSFCEVQTHHVHRQGPNVLQQSGTVSSCNKATPP